MHTDLLPSPGARLAGRCVTDGQGEFTVTSPVREGVLATLPICGLDEVEEAVRVAERAFEGPWPMMHPRERKHRLLDLADRLQADGERLAQIETLDTGRPIREARALDVAQSVARLRWFAELADKLYGDVAPSGFDRLATITREAIGPVAAITPWNFPLMMAVTKIAPALVAGNPVILKPAEQSPLTALILADHAAETLPEGVLQVLTGPGEITGEALVRHPGIRAVGFTGSTATAQRIMESAGRHGMKRLNLEAGGKSPHVILSPGLAGDAMIDQIAWGVAYHQGQVCDAGANLILVGGGHDDLIARVAARFDDITVGDPWDEDIDLASMIDAGHLDGVHSAVSGAVARGVTLRCGGHAADGNGAFYRPTLLDDVPASDPVFSEEVFGPVLAATHVGSPDEAAALVNGSRYGLAAAVWASDTGEAMQFARRLRVGTVAVNCYELGDIGTPFGGTRQSGLARDRSPYALESYSELKTTWAALGGAA